MKLDPIVAQKDEPVTTKPEFNPRDHLLALYSDGGGFRAVVRWYSQTDSFAISQATGQAIADCISQDDAAESSEGYDDDVEATITWLHPNQYVTLMDASEREQVRTFQWEAAPRREAQRRNPLTGHFIGGGRGQ